MPGAVRQELCTDSRVAKGAGLGDTSVRPFQLSSSCSGRAQSDTHLSGNQATYPASLGQSRQHDDE